MENFLDVLVADEDVRENFFKQTTPHGAYVVAKPYIDDMSEKEFVRELAGIARSIDSEILDDEELAKISGGNNNIAEFEKVMSTVENGFKLNQ